MRRTISQHNQKINTSLCSCCQSHGLPQHCQHLYNPSKRKWIPPGEQLGFKSNTGCQGLRNYWKPLSRSLAQQKATDCSANELICCDSCSDCDNCHFPQGFQSTKADNSFVKGYCVSGRQGHTGWHVLSALWLVNDIRPSEPPFFQACTFIGVEFHWKQ